MAIPKKASTDLKTNQKAVEKNIDKSHPTLPKEKLEKIKIKALEPDPWTGKQKPQ
ncbi:MAG: hypothetical protein BWY47_01492 [Bacteroidetes bacterium ADurb.Bin302]|nr:MAG: hypothetical protein BWY47_01492 [Bacteroidetes bacterium ADurb.Bin302]